MAMTMLVYLPCLHGPLLWDDTDWLQGIDWNLRNAAGLWRMWSQPGSIQQYYPVTATTFWFDYQFWGPGATFGPHLENVLLHGGGAVLLWRLLTRLQVRGAWLAAALYALHPVMAESVAWITERKNVLASFFALAALLAHGTAARWWPPAKPSPPWTATLLAGLCFLLAMLSKISVAVLPAVVLVIGAWRSGGLRWKQDGVRMLPWLALVVALMPVTHALEQEQMQHGDLLPLLTWAERLLLAGQLPWFYLGKLLWPQSLCLIYEKWTLHPEVWWHWTGHVVILLGLATLLWKRWSGALALSLLFLGTLFPVLGFFEVNGMKYAWAADRWVHLSSLPVFAAVAHGWQRLPWPRVRLLLASLGLCLLAALTWKQAGLYGDLDRFWQAAIAGNRTPWKAHNDYGGQLLDAGRNAEAASQFEAALRLLPGYAAAHVNLASALDSLGRHEEALAEMDRALAAQPENNAAMHYNRAVILDHLQRGGEAEAALREAIRQKPDFFAAHNDLGNKLLLSGRWDEARQCFDKLLELRPGDAKALTSIGNTHFLKGDTAAALAAFDDALQDDPGLLSALANSAWILSITPDDSLRAPAKALARAAQVVELTQRQDPGMLQIWAAALADSGDFAQAAAMAREGAQLARTQGKDALAVSLEDLAQLFDQGRPYRQMAR